MNERYFPLKVINEDITILVKGTSFQDAKATFERCLQRLVDEQETMPICCVRIDYEQAMPMEISNG